MSAAGTASADSRRGNRRLGNIMLASLPQELLLRRVPGMRLGNPISAVFTFGVFRLDVERGELKRFDTPLHLPPQPFQLLALLASRPGEW